MPGPLEYFKHDPNGLGRGEGWYYHRGHGYYSKYSPVRDRRKKVGGHVTVSVVPGRTGGSPKNNPYAQCTDRRTIRKRGRKKKKRVEAGKRAAKKRKEKNKGYYKILRSLVR